MKKIIFATTVMLLIVFSMQAQSDAIENVHRYNPRNSGAIKEGTDVKGYYLFYASDKVDKKNYEFTLQIKDNNLKMLKEIKFVDSKDVNILEASFNGTDLIFLFYNDDLKTFEYQVYGADGKKKFVYNRQLSKKEKRYLEMTYLLVNDDENNYKGLYPVEGLGFISNMPSREDKDYTFQIDFFSTEKKRQWTYIPTEGAKRFIGDYLGYHNGIVYLEVLKYSGAFDQRPESTILGLSLETGKKVFEIASDSKYRFYPASMSVLNGRGYIFGEYFDVNANIAKDKSKGFGFWDVDEKGKVVSEKYCSWDLELGKYLNVSSKGRIGDFGFMYLHNIVQVSDGNIYAIGEGYKKVASALGILSQVATGGRSGISTAKIRITDMILLKFDNNFNIKEAVIYPKNSNNIELQSGYEFVSTPLIGKMVKYVYGGFDYAYTQLNNNNESFTVCYSDYVRGKDYKGSTFNSISYNEGKITTDKINTKSDASRAIVLPGKQGQVLIIEYYKKEKRLASHFEKLN